MTKWMKQYFAIFIVSIIYLFYPISVSANTDQLNVLILYSLENENQLAEIRILDTLVGQFTNQSAVIEDNNFNPSDLEKATHVIYYGGVEKEIPIQLLQAIKKSTKPIFFMGYNVEQVKERLSFLTVKEETLISKIERVQTKRQYPLETKKLLIN